MNTENISEEKINLFFVRNFICICVLLLLTGFFFAGRFLLINQSPQQAEVIIVLSGGTGRMEKAIDLYKSGHSSVLLLSNSNEKISDSKDMRQTALMLGIPEDDILIENSAQSTYQNAELTLLMMKEHDFKSAIVVSSDFHMRRVKLIFDHVYKKSGIELTYNSSDSGYNATHWWSNRYSREMTFNEYIKIIGNAFGYNGQDAKNSFEQIKEWFRQF